MAATDWKSIAAAKTTARDALIPTAWRITVPDGQLDVTDVPATCGVLSEAELAITETPARELVDKMLKRELTSEQVTTAFCKRAAVAQQLVNCLTEIFFDEAIVAAQGIDANYAATGKSQGPLHGLPFSLKDCFNVRGYDSTVGYIKWCNDPAETESEAVKIIREMGAVLYCKTNLPTSMMVPESYNNVFGYTSNPWNRNTSSGGSSGGEGALIALRGSPLGLGSDIGGSVRIPAALCGIYSLRPSSGRLATYGAKGGLVGQEGIRDVNGPMSSSLDSLVLYTRAALEKAPWDRDPNVIPMPWREVTLAPRLCFGMIVDDGMVRPTPPVMRALRETKAALEAAGHTVIEWAPYDVPEVARLAWSMYAADGGAGIAELIEGAGEPWIQGLEQFRAAYEESKTTPALASAAWKLQTDRTDYAKKSLEHWMDSAKLTGTGRPFDGVISPVSPYAAPLKYQYDHVAYTFLWNVLDQSAVVFPVTHARVDDVKPASFEARSEIEKGNWDRYDPTTIQGAPVGLQVVTRRLEEEKALALAKVCADALEKAKKDT